MWDGLRPEKLEREVGNVIKYRCMEGLKFVNYKVDGNASLTATCNAFGFWDPPLAECQGQTWPTFHVTRLDEFVSVFSFIQSPISFSAILSIMKVIVFAIHQLLHSFDGEHLRCSLTD